MGLINDIVKNEDVYAKNDLSLFAREPSSPREEKDYCFMGMLVDNRKNILNVLTGEKYKNYSYYYPVTINENKEAFYWVKKSCYRDSLKIAWFRLDAYDENSVINGLMFAKMKDDNVTALNNMVETTEYYLGKFPYVSISRIESMVDELNDRIHQTLLERQKIMEELEAKREQYAKKFADRYNK